MAVQVVHKLEDNKSTASRWRMPDARLPQETCNDKCVEIIFCYKQRHIPKLLEERQVNMRFVREPDMGEACRSDMGYPTSVVQQGYLPIVGGCAPRKPEHLGRLSGPAEHCFDTRHGKFSMKQLVVLLNFDFAELRFWGKMVSQTLCTR